MLLWSCVIFALLGPSRAQLQRITQDDAETVLGVIATIKENIYNRIREDGSVNASCILDDIRDRKQNLLHLPALPSCPRQDKPVGNECVIQEQWLRDLSSLKEELERSREAFDQLSRRQKEHLSSTACFNFPDEVALILRGGGLAASKKIIIHLLSTMSYPIVTPDVITLFENVGKIIEQPSVTVEPFGVTGEDVIEDLLMGLLSQNEMQPYENYQILELVSTLDNIRPLKEINLLLLMKPDSYPKDVIEARDKLIVGMGYGEISAEPSPVWPTPPQQLLALLTALTNNPNDNEYVPYAHVLFGYFRLRYLTMMGYEFVPRSIADIAFLINSFLTVRHPILIREIYLEITKIPWKTYVTDIDYTQYSDPRVLFIDMLKAILRRPEALKLCNKLIFQYFIHEDPERPDWLRFPPDQTDPPRPIDVVPGPIPRPPPPQSRCPGEDTQVIDPECLIEIMASDHHASFIRDLIRFNPGTVERYPYNTREAVYQAILNDLKVEKYKDDDINQFVISQAIARLPLNENKTLPPVYTSMCRNEITDLTSREPTPPISEETTNHYKTSSLLTETPDETTECPDACKRVTIIDQQSIIDIITESRTNTIKNIILLKPILYDDYKSLDTREEILKKVLADRNDELNDEILQFVIPQAIDRMALSWDRTLPPVVDEVCENELKYNITVPLEPEPETGETERQSIECVQVKTIDPYSLIEILSDVKNTKSVQKLILEEPILASDYAQYNTRPGVFKAVVTGRSERKGEWQLTYDVKKTLGKVPFNWKHTLPLEYLDECNVTPSPESSFSPSALFNNTIPGLNEKPIPCASTTEMPPDVDTVESTEDNPPVTAPVPVTNAPVPENNNNVQTPPGYEGEVTESPDSEEYCDDEAASALGAGVAEIGTRPNENGQTLGDEVLNSILDTVKLPKLNKKKCKPRPTGMLRCKKGEIKTDVVKIDSLWDALTPESPRAPYIRNKVRAFMVPIDRSKDYTKAEVLKDILLSVREDIRDARVLQNVDQLIKCVRFEGPGIQPPEVEAMCLSNNVLTPPPTDSPNAPTCKRGEVQVTVVQTDTLYSALSPSAPKTPYIRNRINGYIVPVDRSKIYSKGEVLRDILVSLKGDITDPRVIHNIDILIGFILNDGPAMEEPDMVEICLPESAVAESPPQSPTPTPVPPTRPSGVSVTHPPIVGVQTPPPFEVTSPQYKHPEKPLVDPNPPIWIFDTTSPEPEPPQEPTYNVTPQPERSFEITEEPSEESSHSQPPINSLFDTTSTSPAEEYCGLGPLSWPLLLKPLPDDCCWDSLNHDNSHAVQIVNVTDLLLEAVGTPAQLYMASARIASIDIYQKLNTFDMAAYKTKADFVSGLTTHIGTHLPVEQHSLAPVTLKTVCSTDLFDALPDLGPRNKRHIIQDLKEAKQNHSKAMKIGSNLLSK